jgi:hypothetical protein
VQGQVQPTGPAELLQLALFCRQYRRYAGAARLFARALGDEPKLPQGLRYQAASAAALAAAGQGKMLPSEKLTIADKAKLRRQTLDWLRTELKLFTETVADYQKPPATSPLEKLTGPTRPPEPAGLLQIGDQLQRWQQEPALASLREDQQLASLSPEEQKDWRQFWTDVRALDKQARSCFTERQLTGSLTAQHKEQVHEMQLQAGKIYVFDLQSKDFDALLRLEDAKGNKLAGNNDIERGVNLNSRIVFTAKESGTYRLVATAFQGQGVGIYTLVIREFVGKK